MPARYRSLGQRRHVPRFQLKCGPALDLDLNGVMGPDENGLSGWTVQISGPMTQTAVTDGTGQYTFSGLTAGSYTICVLAPATR